MWRSSILFAFLLAIGCDRQTPPASNNKVNVTAPGVNVDVDKDNGKVRVNTNAVKVNVDGK
jgi:hypothetical protein